jgi:hypothetical protein
MPKSRKNTPQIVTPKTVKVVVPTPKNGPIKIEVNNYKDLLHALLGKEIDPNSLIKNCSTQRLSTENSLSKSISQNIQKLGLTGSNALVSETKYQIDEEKPSKVTSDTESTL